MTNPDAGSRFGLKSVARVAVFAALAFGVNAPFLAVPNVETFSLVLFLSGVFLGRLNGVFVALLAGVIFIFFNPNGPQPVLFIGLTQMLGFVLFGLGGGLLRRRLLRGQRMEITVAIAGLAGLILTFWYDLSTNMVFAVMFGPFWPVLIGGISFAVLHIVFNTVIFAFSGTVIRTIWRRVEFYLPPLAG